MSDSDTFTQRAIVSAGGLLLGLSLYRLLNRGKSIGAQTLASEKGSPVEPASALSETSESSDGRMRRAVTELKGLLAILTR